ncbi:zinc finger protein 208-like [Lutzomyia longipalpis]|uniref:zinc finger protein 208-like n=1 Tax=Lutzomyia longipalpis TaxID=7200 RepID=UPI0024842D1F|nr:zinc finger protein 208-like [Lutzomyia longipalpis]
MASSTMTSLRKQEEHDQDEIPSDDEDFIQNWIEYQEDINWKGERQFIRQLCYYCDAKFPSVRQWMSHEGYCQEGQTKRFPCQVCRLNFTTQQILKQHEERHQNPGGFPCSSCNENFTTAAARLEHREAQHREFQCQICMMKCSTSVDYVQHILTTHRDVQNTRDGNDEQNLNDFNLSVVKTEPLFEEPFESVVEIKNEEISYETNMRDPFVSEDEESDNEEEKTLTTSRNVEFHCRICGKKYCKALNLVAHLKQKHNMQSDDENWPPELQSFRNKTFQCKKCLKEYPNKYQLVLHNKETHAKATTVKTKKYACKDCQCMYVESEKLVRHYKVKHNKNYENDPQFIEDCVKMRKQYYCEICDREFPTPSSLMRHKYIHDPEKKHFCRNCRQYYGCELREHKLTCNAAGRRGVSMEGGQNEKEVPMEIIMDYVDLGNVKQEDVLDHLKQEDDFDYFDYEIQEDNPVVEASTSTNALVDINYYCHICGKKFCKAIGLMGHLKNNHEMQSDDENWPEELKPDILKGVPVTCEICQCVFSGELARRSHMRISHASALGLTRPKSKPKESMTKSLKDYKVSCNVCNLVCENDAKLEEHTAKFHAPKTHRRIDLEENRGKSKKFMCKECRYIYLLPSDLILHYRAKHNKDIENDQQFIEDCSIMRKKYICNICNREFPTFTSLMRHKDVHARERESSHGKKVLSSVNEKAFQSETAAKLPQRPSGGYAKAGKGRKYECKECRCIYLHPEQLIVHYRVKHMKDFEDNKEFIESCAVMRKRYICRICDKEFAACTSLVRHKEYHDANESLLKKHREVCQFKCTICSKILSTKSSFELHKKSHKDHVEAKCEIEKVSVESFVKKEHSDDEYDKLACNDAENAAATDTKGRDLSLLDDEEEHCCHICGATYFRSTNLMLHLQRKHNTSPDDENLNLQSSIVKKLTCKVCQTICFNAKQLTLHTFENHEKISSLSKKFTCKDCNCIFLQREMLIQHYESKHNRNIENDPQFTENYVVISRRNDCKICGKEFARSDTLRKHKRQHIDGGIGLRIYCHNCNKDFTDVNDLMKHKETCNFQCAYCNKILGLKVSLKKHLKSHIDRSFGTYFTKCKKCGQRCKTQGDYKDHKNTNCGKEAAFKCERCTKIFRLRRKLREHMFTHGEKPYACTSCEMSFKSPFERKAHMKSHVNDLLAFAQKFYCKVCNKGFRIEAAYAKHMRNLHGIEVEVICPTHGCKFCKGKFYNEACLQRHMIKRHTFNGKVQIKCKHCDEFFDDKAAMMKHIKASHVDVLTCTLCNKSLSSETGLQNHIQRHHEKRKENQRKFLCELCGKTFNSCSVMRQHEENCGKSPQYQCDQCQKFFTTAGTLKSHKVTHSGVRAFPCQFCDKKFFKKHQALVHERIHTGEKLFKCTYCSEAFVHYSTLQIHLSTHTGVKRYVCSGCGDRFTCQSNLRAHRKSNASTCGLTPLMGPVPGPSGPPKQ